MAAALLLLFLGFLGVLVVLVVVVVRFKEVGWPAWWLVTVV
jgi:hypothetical protein